MFQLNLTRITIILHEHLCTFMIISCLILFKTRNISDKNVEKIKTCILSSINYFPGNRAVYELMSVNIEPDRLQMII